MLGPRDIVSVSTLSALAVLAAPLPSAGQEANALSAVQRRVLDLADVTVGGRRFEVHAFDGHVHTEHSMDARLPTRQVLAVAEAVGLDTLIITDHGTTSADREVQAYGGPLSVLIGAEVGGDYGHALLWNLRNREGMAVAAESMPTLGAFARRHGALAVLAHPGWWFGHHPWDPRRWMHIDALRRGGISETVDALELWNGQYWHRTRELIDEWAALIEQGIFVPVVGSSDFHLLTRQRLGVPFNAFLCPVGADRAACLVEAVRGGRL